MAKKAGLGKGLESLMGGADAEVSAITPESSLPISKIKVNKNQPRKNFDPDLLDELADSIKQNGILQPILVRKKGASYEIVAGERRYQAAKLAGLKEIPVNIKEISDEDVFKLALIENLQRSDLNPIEEAQGYEILQQTYGMTQEAVAQSVGKSRPAIANAMRLLMLSEPVRQLVESGELSAGHARALLPLEHPDVQLNIAQTILQKHLSVRRAEALVDSLLKQPELETTKKDENAVDYLGECARTLENALGRRVRLQQGRKVGKIELEFYGADDREALIEALRTLPKRK